MEQQIGEAIVTGAGILWKALWALIFGYLISAGIQVLVTQSQMAKTLGKPTAKAGVLASFFGFISSSCSFAALAASRSIWTKGAHPINALAFLVASTNLVIELGIVLWVLMGWQFFLANMLLGLFMVVYLYVITKFWFPDKLAKGAKKHAEQTEIESGMDMDGGKNAGRNWRKQLSTVDGWRPIADAFFMEWKMAYKEILFGFTLAGFITVFVPQSVWNHLFLIAGNSGANAAQPGLFIVLENALIAPVVAFFTFIGSMGNVPLAALLWSKNASFGGVMSFLGADLVAATVLWMQAKYYGWKYTAYLAGLLYLCMVAAGLSVHLVFSVLHIIPETRQALADKTKFAIDYTFFLNIFMGAVGLGLVYLHLSGQKTKEGMKGMKSKKMKSMS